MTAVPSAVRGLTTLFEMEEVNTRLTNTNLIDSFDHLLLATFSDQYQYVFFPTEKETDSRLIN